ncbi:MAG: Crp/Fnr family transcriptional regulator [Candidatus Manganitrophaceae bacterium]|nr:MAG: Crp/Fnr family transcriptional regulator [Candidatus Manganitrophaceae bacterium]
MKQIASQMTMEKPDLIQFIQSCDPYSLLSHHELETIHPKVRILTIEKGKSIYLPGHPSDQVYLVYTGSIRIATLMESGKEFTSSLYHVGETFGELSLAGEMARVDMAISYERSVLISLKTELLSELLKQNPLFTLGIMRLIGARRYETENRLLQFFYAPVHSRLAKVLIHFANKQAKSPSSSPIQLRLTHEILASLAGTTRETTTMILNRFQKLGMIHKSKGNIFVKDLQSLKALSLNQSSPPKEPENTLTLTHAA